MGKWRARMFGLHGRVIIYVVVIVALLVMRGGIDWNRVKSRLSPPEPTPASLSLAGLELAPKLIPRLAARYRQDYPDLTVEFMGGGTARALEALVNRRAEVAFLSRPPTREEQDAFASADGDTALWFPIAMGGIVVLRGPGSGVDSLRAADLRDVLHGDAPPAGVDRLYVPDPNSGLWDALRSSLGLDVSRPGPPPNVVFLADMADILQGVEADPAALGIGSTLSLPADLDERGIRIVPVRADDGPRAAYPSYEEIGYGEYPLAHHLYVACRAQDDRAGSMFVTHVTSARGQRQIERDGFLPATRPLREVIITTEPVGEAG